MTNKITNFNQPNFKQQGVTLVIALIVLLALTMLGLASTTDNRLQSVMVRNDQFRFEAFNASYSEIDAQVDVVNNRTIAQGIPTTIFTLITNGVGSVISSGDSPVILALMTPLDDVTDSGVTYTGITKAVSKEYATPCVITGESLAVGSSTNSCFEFRIQSTATLDNTSIGSTQNQVYQYVTPDLSEG